MNAGMGDSIYLSDIFNILDEDEIPFEIRDGETPAQFTGGASNQDRCLAVVMPMGL